MGKFILIDFKKMDEHKRLKKLGPALLSKMNRWIARYEDGTPTEEECTTMEAEKIAELTQEFDTEAEKLWRVKKEVPKERSQFVRSLQKKEGKLFKKFTNAVEALKEQAADLLTYCSESYETFEADLRASFPVGDDTIGTELNDFLEDMKAHIEESYPEGVAGLDSYDDELPNGILSFADFCEMVQGKEDELKAASADAIEAKVQEIKDGSQTRFKISINEAIQATIDEIVADLSDDTLPYLGEEDMQALRDELIAGVKEYGESRLDN